jgi:AraC family transcriptional regulator of adaptative response/methylated-DNA-[protein]-cysteine methyltransferase
MRALSDDYLRIENAIIFLDKNFRERPDLRTIAASVNLSEYHFQRLFRRWAGISPKQFLQFLTLGYAKQLLKESKSLLDVTYESGLSSPGRLHDLFVTIDAVSPGEFKRQGAGLSITYGFHDSPFGDCFLASTGRGICALAFATRGGRPQMLRDFKTRWQEAKLSENPKLTQPVLERIFRPAKNGSPYQVDLFLRGTNFQVRVWEALLKIPMGTVVSYGDIARHIGEAGASQAVGNAVGQNPVAFLIPCHRVIRSAGVIGEYRGGTARKKALLAWEAAQTHSNASVPAAN